MFPWQQKNQDRGEFLITYHMSTAENIGTDTGDRAAVELSSVETDILAMLACGRSAQEISNFVSLSPNTVIIYQNVVREKMGAKSCAHAVARAIKLGLISLEEIN